MPLKLLPMHQIRILGWAVTVGLGGFLFGFDTAVISGVEEIIQNLWDLDEFTHGQMMAMALYGTVIGALAGGWLADAFGRKRMLFWIGVLYLVSAAGSALAPEVYTLMTARFLGGLGVGASSVIAPMYISEIAPAEQRGRLVAIFQFNIVFGILVALGSNYLFSFFDLVNWRWMLGVEVFPAIAFVFLVLGVPRSPRWLVVRRGQETEALEVLRSIDAETAEAELARIRASDLSNSGTGGSLREFFSGAFNVPIALAFMIAFFNQLSGINAILYYAPRVFKMAGLEEQSSLLASFGVGAVNLVFTLLGMLLIDRYGRKKLMYLGSVGYIVSLAAVAVAFYTGNTGTSVPIWLFVFIASHAVGQGAVIWVFINEIFPNEYRSFGSSLGSGTHWVFAALITAVFPIAAAAFSPVVIFGFFAGMMVLQLLWVWRVMPETKGVSLEALQERLIGK